MTPEIASILGAFLGAAAAIVVSIINSRVQHNQFVAQMDKQTALIDQRLAQVEKKVDAHNHFDTRLVALEEQVKTLFSEVRNG